MPISVKVISNRLAGAALHARQRAGQISEQSAKRIAADAKTRVAVDTGETRDHIEAVKAGAFTWNVVSARPSTDGSANVPAFLEYGTQHMPARPYLTPAAEADRANYHAAFDKLLDGLI